MSLTDQILLLVLAELKKSPTPAVVVRAEQLDEQLRAQIATPAPATAAAPVTRFP